MPLSTASRRATRSNQRRTSVADNTPSQRGPGSADVAARIANTDEPLGADELRHWTAAYAQPLSTAGARAEKAFVLFRLGSERFAVPIDDLDEVACVTGGISLANAGTRVIGLTNTRGEVLPLLDTGALLDARSEPSIGARNRTLVVRDGRGRRAGLPVDAVIGVAKLDPASFSLYPRHGGQSLVRRAGLAEHADQALTLVDLSALRRESLDQF